MIINGQDMLAVLMKLNDLCKELEVTRNDAYMNLYVLPPLLQARNNLSHHIHKTKEREKGRK